MKKSLKHDMRYLISVLLLIAATVACFSGWLADVWGINTFIIHTWSGYTMALLALVHTLLEWPRLWAYVRVRLRRRTPLETSPPPVPVLTPAPAPARSRTTPPLITRRELIGVLVGGAIGFAGGWRSSSPQRMQGETDWGIQYHAWSKPGFSNFLSPILDWGKRPAQYKVYPQAPRLSLPAPGDAQGLSLDEAIRQRRSIRSYAATSISQETLSRLLFYADGINAEQWGTRLRAAPSAGALYPLEIYVVVHRVEGLEAGVYHYAVQDHALMQLRTGDMRDEVMRAGLLQRFLGEANVVLIVTAIFQRLRWKYRERTYRYALLEAGHIGQNIYLAATALGMGACAVGAFDDDALNALVGVDGQEEAAVYMLAVGRMA
ncbi:MAG TPA: SagB/ThcOx family dehydrogenase [Anaerolineae bacterium]|nr:SagB/ThcOx family dehydrogenase [Anaerolineae bacterium]HQK12591.1 SagB/ThcOx family dehydrogenase [Anaerolineae bacterium]